jgi:hypothetical protein
LADRITNSRGTRTVVGDLGTCFLSGGDLELFEVEFVDIGDTVVKKKDRATAKGEEGATGYGSDFEGELGFSEDVSERIIPSGDSSGNPAVNLEVGSVSKVTVCVGASTGSMIEVANESSMIEWSIVELLQVGKTVIVRTNDRMGITRADVEGVVLRRFVDRVDGIENGLRHVEIAVVQLGDFTVASGVLAEAGADLLELIFVESVMKNCPLTTVKEIPVTEKANPVELAEGILLLGGEISSTTDCTEGEKSGIGIDVVPEENLTFELTELIERELDVPKSFSVDVTGETSILGTTFEYEDVEVGTVGVDVVAKLLVPRGVFAEGIRLEETFFTRTDRGDKSDFVASFDKSVKHTATVFDSLTFVQVYTQTYVIIDPGKGDLQFHPTPASLSSISVNPK